MKKQIVSLLLLTLIASSPVYAQSVAVPPKLLEAAIELFPGLKGPYDLQFKSDMRMHRQGFEAYTYILYAAKNDVGTVTRIRSVMKDGPAAGIDVVVRYDGNGLVAGVKNIADPATGGVFEPVYYLLKDKDPRQFKEALTVIANGFAAGATARDAVNPDGPPKDYVLDLRQKILIPGATLPAMKAQDSQGGVFDTSRYRNEHLIMVFTSPDCVRCDDMLAAVQKGIEASGKKTKVKLVYIISAGKAEAEEYGKSRGLKGIVVPEPTDAVSQLFQVPFKPYALMFEKGVLKYNAPWEAEDKFLGFLYLFTGGEES